MHDWVGGNVVGLASSTVEVFPFQRCLVLMSEISSVHFQTILKSITDYMHYIVCMITGKSSLPQINTDSIISLQLLCWGMCFNGFNEFPIQFKWLLCLGDKCFNKYRKKLVLLSHPKSEPSAHREHSFLCLLKLHPAETQLPVLLFPLIFPNADECIQFLARVILELIGSSHNRG